MDGHNRSVAMVNGVALLALAVTAWFMWLFRGLPGSDDGLDQLAVTLGVILPLWAVGLVRAVRARRH
ncbi:hypothetical protein [Demequina soli]|uniref:hypothetical protein n=1 Tax=Demequina soli TaxID=1638987 RepID=UPI0007851DDE|nr:hypothetical protein [Demequina soli]